jgi:enterochelin esterase-like enzyme
VRRRWLVSGIAGVALFCATPAVAQTRVVRIASKLLGEERVLHVSLPPNYALAKQRYQVIYLLDGHVRQFFDLTVAAAAYDLTGDAHDYAVPPQIVVGIDQRDRGADLGRNQELFTRFLVEELVPYIDREYRTAPYRTLIGHSLGGRFALMTLCRAPGVFPAVIAISAAGGDSTSSDAVTRCLQQAFASERGALRQLVLSAGDREARTLAGVQRLRDLLGKSAPANWRWTVIDGAGLGHTATPLATIPPGIRFLHDASMWEMLPASGDSVVQGLLDPNTAIAAFYSGLSARVGSPVSPSRKWLLAAAHVYAKGSVTDVAEAAVQRVLSAYPEDLEAYGMLSDLALRRRDPSSARRALEDAMRMLDRLDFFDVYDRERKRQIIKDALAAIPR